MDYQEGRLLRLPFGQTQTLHGTAIGLPITWGGARGVCLGRHIHGSPMGRVWDMLSGCFRVESGRLTR